MLQTLCMPDIFIEPYTYLRDELVLSTSLNMR